MGKKASNRKPFLPERINKQDGFNLFKLKRVLFLLPLFYSGLFGLLQIFVEETFNLIEGDDVYLIVQVCMGGAGNNHKFLVAAF